MHTKRIFAALLIAAFFILSCEDNAFARAGGGRSGSSGSSYGSRGSRTYTAPSTPFAPNQYQQQTQQAAPMPQPAPSGGGFWRGLAGGIVGGMIGGLIFRGGFGGGIGLFDILLLGLGIYLIYRLIRSKKEAAQPVFGRNEDTYNYQQERAIQPAYAGAAQLDPISAIRNFDPYFDEAAFRETVTDVFFKVQAAWMNRDIESSKQLFAADIFERMRDDVAKLKQEGRINRLENIAMRKVEITEAWQEQGKDYFTVELNANVLDYVTDDSGKLLERSRTEPVKFVEYWTFVRLTGTNNLQLSAIQQAG